MGECLIVRSSGGIDTSNATVSPDVMVSGYTCYVGDDLINGIIPVIKDGKMLYPDEEISLKEGYYNKNIFTTSSMIDTTTATSTEKSIRVGYDGWANGLHVVGSIEEIGDEPVSLQANESYIIPQGWHSGIGKITQNIPIQEAVAVTPINVEQTLCDIGKWTTGDLTVIGDSNLISDNIKNGVEIFGLTGSFVGWIDTECPVNQVASISGGGGSYWDKKGQGYNATAFTVGTMNDNAKLFSSMRIDGHLWGASTLSAEAGLYFNGGPTIVSYYSSGSTSGFNQSGSLTRPIYTNGFYVTVWIYKANCSWGVSAVLLK